MERPARILTSAGFIAGLVLLLVNDLVLKQAYPGVVTGKLSDFAGLFIFPMFWAAFRPRWSREIYVATALAFVWWKSPSSQGAIDGWNALGLWDVGRVVDWTDLAALAVLPLSIAYDRSLARSTRLSRTRTRLAPPLLLAAALAFAATSYGGRQYELTPSDPETTYTLGIALEDFATRLDESGLWHSSPDPSRPDLYYVGIGEECRSARFVVGGDATSTTLSLVYLGTEYNCEGARDGKAKLRRGFEQEVIARLLREVDPYKETNEPKGRRLDYDPMGSYPRSSVQVDAADMAQAMDTYPQKHRQQDGEFIQSLGYGYFVRFRVHPTDTGTDLEVIGYINRDGGEKTAEEMEPRFQYYLDYVLGHAGVAQ